MQAHLHYEPKNNSNRSELYYDKKLDLNVHVFEWTDSKPIPFVEGDIIDVVFDLDTNDQSTYQHKIIRIEGNRIYSAEFYRGDWYRYKMFCSSTK
jgi:hypothetical protein